MPILHQLDMEPDPAKPGIDAKDHGITGQQQQDDRGEDPPEEPAKDPRPQREARVRFQRRGGGPQHLVGEEHTADPNHSREAM